MEKHSKEMNELVSKLKQIKKDTVQMQKSLADMSSKKRGIIDTIKVKNNEANREKELRDQLNSKIKKHKKERERLNSTIKQMIDEYEKLEGKSPKADFKKMEKELNAYEWKLQTSVLDIKKEDELVKRIEKLKKELVAYKELIELSKKIEKQRKASKKVHEKVLSLSEESQKHHEKFLEAVGKIKELELQIDEVNKNKTEISSKLDKMREEANTINSKLGDIEKEMEKLETEAYPKGIEPTEKELKERAEMVYERFKSGEKLNLEDIYLLRRFNLV